MTLPDPAQRAGVTIAEAQAAIAVGYGFTIDPATGCWIWEWPDEKSGAGPFLAFYCNTPEAPIWMGDYTHRSIRDVRPGDEVIGWHTPEGRRMRLTRSTVVAKLTRRAPVVRVTMESGRVIRCTPDHQWLRSKTYSGATDRRSDFISVAPGRTLSSVVEVPEQLDQQTQRVADWLAGIYDGEGHRATISQDEGYNDDVRERIARSLDALGITYWTGPKGLQITGGRAGIARFAALTRPTRYRSMDKAILTGKFRVPDRILSVEDDGEDEVVSMQTTTGNYVAWGYASKNCAVFGDVPDTMDVIHTCDGLHRGCVNPEHLDLGTASDRVDRVEPTGLDVKWFAHRIRDELDARGGTERILATELGISVTLLRRWVLGTVDPTMDEIRRASDRMGWDGRVRKWVVTSLVQTVVEEPSSGDAVRRARELLTPPGQAPKIRVVETRVVR